MKIEKEILRFVRGYQLEPLKLSKLQLQYVSVLTNNNSIEATVLFFLKQGWLVSFCELYDLIEKLVKNSIIINPSLISYFHQHRPQPLNKAAAEDHKSTGFKIKIPSYLELPFFRNLDERLASLLLSQAKVVRLSPCSYICKSGELSREMFVLLKGQAGIYRPAPNNRHQLISTLSEGGIFGEAGFFLGSPRSANIITQKESDVLVIPYQDEILDKHVDKSKAQSLQLRFWIQQALHHSSIFKNIPSDCLDSLGFSGKVVQMSANSLLFKEGSAGSSAYIVIQGSLVASQNGKAIAKMSQGSFFGEVSLLASQGKRTATIHSQQDSLLVEIQRDEFYKILSQNLFLAKELEVLTQERLKQDQLRSAG